MARGKNLQTRRSEKSVGRKEVVTPFANVISKLKLKITVLELLDGNDPDDVISILGEIIDDIRPQGVVRNLSGIVGSVVDRAIRTVETKDTQVIEKATMLEATTIKGESRPLVRAEPTPRGQHGSVHDRVVALLKESPTTYEEMMRKLGDKTTKGSLQTLLYRLKQQNKISQEKKYGPYKLVS